MLLSPSWLVISTSTTTIIIGRAYPSSFLPTCKCLNVYLSQLTNNYGHTLHLHVVITSFSFNPSPTPKDCAKSAALLVDIITKITSLSLSTGMSLSLSHSHSLSLSLSVNLCNVM